MSGRVVRVHMDLEPGEQLHITPLSDLHVESSCFDRRGFDSLMAERQQLPNHRAILIGDVMDMVVPVDTRRYRPSVQDPSISERDDWINAAVDLAVERLTAHGTTYDMVSPGNHEDEAIKRHGIDVISMLARELRCARGGYSGYIEYHFRCADGKQRAPVFRIAWHHGAWGGKTTKGYTGARDWFRTFSDWHVACYGHNHQTAVNRESMFRPTRSGTLVEQPVYYVCSSSFVHNYTKDAKTTTYAERAGYAPAPRKTPLIKVTPTHSGTWGLEYSVEV